MFLCLLLASSMLLANQSFDNSNNKKKAPHSEMLQPPTNDPNFVPHLQLPPGRQIMQL